MDGRIPESVVSALAQQYAALLQRAFPERHVLEESELFPSKPSDTPELVWQSRWFAGDFGREFVSLDGQPVRIVQLGIWNHGPGPDFQECAVEIDGQLLRGCIELDPQDRDWERHGHAANPDYENVVLHVFLHQSRERCFTRTASHKAIVQVHLLPVQPSPDEADRKVPSAKPGRCQKLVLNGWSETRVNHLLAAAARFRLERKGRRWQRLAHLHGAEEAHFQGLAECLGYRHNKLPMTVLAQQFSLKSLLKHPSKAEAWLFGASGFLDEVKFDESDPPTRAYLRGLWETWWKHRATWKESPASKRMPWATASTRPTNHPQRRVAALAEIAASWSSIGPLLTVGGFREAALVKTLLGLKHAYWDHHYTLTSEPVKESLAILGRTRICEMLANFIYPALVMQSELHWEGYLKLKSQLANEKTKLAGLRLFGQGEQAKTYEKKIFQQQGLLQIYEDFCLVDASDCASCPFPEQLLTEF